MAKIQLKQKETFNIQNKIEQINKKFWQEYYAKIKKGKSWKDLAILLQEVRKLKKEIDNFEAKIKTKLQDILQRENKEVLEDAELKVMGKWQKRSVLDVKKLKQEMPNVYEQFKTESLSFVIRITKK